MQRSVKSFLFLGITCAALALISACADTGSPVAVDAPQTAQPAPAERLSADLSVTCQSRTQFACGARAGCEEKEGEAQEPPVTFAFNGPEGAGELCVLIDGQSICRSVAVNAIPGETPGVGDSLTGLILSEIPQDDPAAAPAHLFDGLVTLAQDGLAFRLVQANPEVAVVWSGACTPTSAAPAAE